MDLDYVAIYGAVVSTILAGREYLNSRPRFELSSCNFGHPEYDDVITIYNNSNRNVVINSLSINKGGKNISLGNESDYYLINIKPQEAHNIY